MKTSFWILANFALIVSAVPPEEINHGSDPIPLENAEDSQGKSEEEVETIRTRVPVRYFLYTQANPEDGQEVQRNVESIASSNFNPANPTIFVIHGWNQNYTSQLNPEIRDAWLSLGDCNVFVVDWARARSIEYASSVVAVSRSGKKVAGMINFLHQQFNVSLSSVQVIGHSLGAHVAGFAGKNVEDGQVHIIVGLDPAKPLFLNSLPKKRLSSTDAFYVESIHTNAGQDGFLKPIGKADFYANGGRKQPACDSELDVFCSHRMSWIYYAEAIRKNNFPAKACDTYRDALRDNCGDSYSSVRMGDPANAYVAEGSYYVPVNSEPPYGVGN